MYIYAYSYIYIYTYRYRYIYRYKNRYRYIHVHTYDPAMMTIMVTTGIMKARPIRTLPEVERDYETALLRVYACVCVRVFVGICAFLYTTRNTCTPRRVWNLCETCTCVCIIGVSIHWAEPAPALPGVWVRPVHDRDDTATWLGVQENKKILGPSNSTNSGPMQ